jgi:filamentous hemagglutinin family protein
MPQEAVQIVGWRRCSRGALLGGTALRAAALVVLATPANAQLAAGAHPSGGSVVGGSASITQNGTTTDITQKSGRAAIDWQSFNVGSAAKVVFAQPSSSAVALNTVVGPNPSEIAGRITANGVVAIVNQSGVIFDQGSQVDTAGLVVSAAGITRQNFMNGHMVFDQAAHPGARVVNNGAITIRQAGLAALVAPQVANNGLITAKLGRVVLGGATTYTLDLYGDGLLALNVTGQVTQVSLGGRTIPALVTNAGTILADGGTVVLNASAADGLIRTLVEAGGTVQANSVGTQAGRIVVEGIGGSVDIAGAVSATGAAAGSVGGTIVANATGTVSLASSARVNASGSSGGGLVAIGTTVARARSRSAHATLTASTVDVAAGAQIAASATARGNGGQVTLLSTGTTSLGGAITVMGGALGGNGGAAEVSGGVVSLQGIVDARAPAGAMGGLLIDPNGIVIADTSPSHAKLAGASYFSPAALQAAGLLGNVTLTTQTHVTLGGTFSGQAGDIDFAYSGPPGGAIHNTLALGNSGLTILADGNINIDKGFTISAGAITMNASGAAINFDSATGVALGIVATASTTSAILSGTVVNMTATTGIGLAAATVTGTTSLNMTTTGAGIASGGAITTDLLTASAATSINLLGTNVITDTGTIATTDPASTGIAIDNTGPLIIGGAMTASAGNILLSTSGKLTLDGEITTKSAAGSVSLTTTGAGDLIEANGSGGGISAGALTGSIAGSAQLLGANQFATLSAFSANGTLQLLDGALTVAGLDHATGLIAISVPTLNVAAGGTLSAGAPMSLQAGSFTVASTGTIFAGTAAVPQEIALSLQGPGTFSVGASPDTISGASLNRIGIGPATIVLGSLNGSSADPHVTALTITDLIGSSTTTFGLFANGPITETVADGTSITAASLFGTATGAISLSGTNAIGTVSALSAGGGIGLTDGGTLTVNGLVQANGGALSVTGSGAGAASAIDIVAAGTLSSSGSIVLQADNFAISGKVTTTGLVAIDRNSAGALSVGGGADNFGGDGLGGVVAGTLALGSLNGVSANGSATSIAISQSLGSAGMTLGLFASGTPGTITEAVSNTVIMTAKALIGSASGNVSLNGTNTVGTLASFASTGGSLAFTDTGSLTTSGNQSALTGLSITAGTLGLASNVTTAALVSLTAPGGIAQSAGTITATSLTATAASGGISIADANNAFGTVTGASALDSITLSTGGSLQLTGVISGAAVSLAATGGALTEGSGGVIDATSLTGSASTGISLATATNSFTTLAALTASGGAITLVDEAILSVTGSVAATGGSAGITSTGAGTLTIDAGISGSGVSLSSAGAMALGADLAAAAGTVTLAAAGNIKQSAGTITAQALTGSAPTGTVALTDSNAVGTITSFAAKDFSLKNGGTLSVAGPLTASSGGVTLSAPGISVTGTLGALLGTVSLTSPGSTIAETGDINASSLTGSAGGAVTLDGTNKIGTLADFSITSGGFSLFDTSSATGTLQVAGLVQVTGDAPLIVRAPTLTVTSSGALAAGTTTSGGTIGLETNALTLTGNVTTGTDGIVGFDLIDAGTLSLGSASFPAFTTVSTGTLSVGSPDGTAADASGKVTAISIAGSYGVPNALALFTSGSVTETASAIVSATSLSGSAGMDISLAGTANLIGTLAALTAHDSLSVVDSEALTIGGTGAVSSGGVLSLDVTGGTISAGAGATLGAASNTLTLTSDTGVSEAATGSIVAQSISGTAPALSLIGVNAIATLTSLDATTGALTIDDAPASATPTVSVTGSVSAQTSLTISLSGAASTLDLAGALSGATVALSAPAGIGQASGGISATVLTADSSLGGVSLTSITNTIGTLGASTTKGNFALTDYSLANPGTLNVAGPVTVGALTTLVLRAPAIATTGELSAPGGTIVLESDSNSFGAAVTTGAGQGVVSLDSFAGTTLTVAGNFTDITTGVLALGSLNGTSASGDITNITITSLDLGSTAPTLGLFTTALGTVSGSGITATTLIGNAGTVSLTGANSITTLGSFSAASFLLDDGHTLAITGPLTSSSGATLTDAGFGVTVGGAIAATDVRIAAGDITIDGSIAGTAPASLQTLTLIATAGGAATGTISAPGTIDAGTLTGSATAGAQFTISAGNTIATLGSFTTHGSGGFTLEDDAPLTITGPLVIGGVLDLHGANGGGIDGLVLDGDISAAGASLISSNGIVQLGGDLQSGGSLALTADGLASTSAGGVTTKGINFAGTLSASTGMTLVAKTAGITEATGGSVVAGTLTGSSAGTASLDVSSGNSIGTLGAFTTTAGGDLLFQDENPADLVINGLVSVAGIATLSNTTGIAQTGGGIQAAGDLTLTAGDGIIQAAGASLVSTGGNLGLSAGGGANTASGGVTTSGISFAGTLSAVGGTATLIASAGDIAEVSGARVIAETLTGSATASGDGTGQIGLGIAAQAGFGNDVATIGSITASGDIAFEDDVLPTVAGPITAGGLTLIGPIPGGVGGTDPVAGVTNLILDASISVTGTLNFNSPTGIVQLGGAVGSTGHLTLTAANGIVQAAGSLTSTDGNLALTAKGASATSAAGVTTAGISFAGTLAAATGTASLVTSAGDIGEVSGARLIADTLTGSATASGAATGQAALGITATSGSGNDVGTLGAFTTSGGLALEDDVLPAITGPLTVGGALAITGPSPGGAGGTDPVPGATDLILDANITAASASFDSLAGIVQLGGDVQASGGLTLSAANGIIQTGGTLASTGGNLGLSAGGAASTVSNGVTASGIAFAGVLSAVSGTATLIASAGDIGESQGARLIAASLAGSATAGGNGTGAAALGITGTSGAGNDIATLGSISTAGSLAVEDDVLPTIAGPITVGAGFTLTGQAAGGGAGTDPVPGATNLVLNGPVTVTGALDFTSFAGIVQSGGLVQATGDLTLTAANGIIQSAGSLVTSGNLNLTAAGGASTTAGAVTTSGISFAGTLSSVTGTATLTADAGDVGEVQGARLIADTLAGSSTAGGGEQGNTNLGISATAGAGNDVATLGSFTTSGSFALEDDVLPTLAGPLTIGGNFALTGPSTGGGGGSDPVPGNTDLILDADISIGGVANFDSASGIVQLGGALTSTGDLTLQAGNGIIQLAGDGIGASTLASTAGNLQLTAGGAASTTSSGVTTTGIAFAGTLSATSTATGQGTMSLAASAGDIDEQPSGNMSATLLTGSATLNGAAPGRALFDVTSGNTVSVLHSFTTSSDFVLEDDISPDITGPLHAGGLIDVHGPNGGGTGPGSGPVPLNLVLDGSVTAGSTASFDSGTGIVQLGGTVTSVGNLTLQAGSGIIQFTGDATPAVLNSSGGNVSLQVSGAGTTTATGTLTTGVTTLSTTGITVAGTLSAGDFGTVGIVASDGDILEQPGGRLIAGTLTGSAAGTGPADGNVTLVTATGAPGNDIANIGSFTVSGNTALPGTGNFTLDDDVLPDVKGPLFVSGYLDINGTAPTSNVDPIIGFPNLIISGSVIAGSAGFNSYAGIIQISGSSVQTTGNLTLTALDGIIQDTGALLVTTGGNLALEVDLGGSGTTVLGSVTTSGISFAGTLSATGTQSAQVGTVSLVANTGDITEQPTGQLLAHTLTGNAFSNPQTAEAGQTALSVASGNTVSVLGSFASSASFTLEDDISPTVTGPVSTVDGGITIYGPSVSGTRTGTAGDLTLAANITAGGATSSILFDSAGGIIQLGGTITAGDNLTLDAGDGIIQAASGTVGTLTLPSVLVAGDGNISLNAAGGAATASSGVTTTGISFAGTLSAVGTSTGQGTVSFIASAGDIVEQSTGQLSATVLTGTATAGAASLGQALFGVAAGNTIGTLAAFTTSAAFTLEDDVSPDITGPLSIGGALSVFGPNGAGTGGTTNLVLDADITSVGAASFDGANGIVQLGGTVTAGGDLTLTASNGIVQFTGDATGASVLDSTGGNLILQAGGATLTTAMGTLGNAAGTLSATGIAFAGTLSAFSTLAGQGTVSLIATAGDIVEQSTGELSATLLTGSAAPNGTIAVGQALFDVASGNTVTILGAFATSADFTLEDDVSPDIIGPLTAGGAIDVHGPNGGGTGFTDLILDGDITALGAASFDSGMGIIQLGGTVRAGGDLVLTAGNGIIQSNGDAAGLAVLTSTAGNVSLSASGAAATASNGVTTTGIDFAGTLSAQTGTVSVIAKAGDIIEEPTGILLADTLTGAASAGTVPVNGTLAVGQALFDIVAGNSVTTLGAFVTNADLTLEDDISPTIAGPLSIGGSLAIFGANGGGTLGDLILSGVIAVGGSAYFDGADGIIQTGGTLSTGTSLTLIAGNGIIQSAGALMKTGTDLSLSAYGTASTTAGTFATTGIGFAGTLSAAGTATFSALHGDILEQPTGKLLASTLNGTASGQALLDVTAGNSVTTLGSFTTGGDFALEDDISPDITGPLSIGGSLTVHGKNNGGTGGGDLILDAIITAAGSASFDSGEGIVQSGGSLQAGGNITLQASNGILQYLTGTLIDSTGGNLSLTADGGASTGFGGIATTGISFAGTLAAASGTVTLVAKAGDVTEAASGQLLAGALTSSSTSASGITGQSLFNVASGNVVGTVLSFATGGDFILEDDVSPTVNGPLTAGGSIAIFGANGGGTIGDIVLLGDVDAKGGTLSLYSSGGIVQQGGTAQGATGLSFAAGNGIIQFSGDAPAVLLSGGTLSLVAAGAGNTTASGTVVGGVTALSTNGIVLSGTLTAPTVSLVADAGSITGTASATVSATTLTGSASGTTALTGANIVATLGSFTSAGFTFTDTAGLTLADPLDAGPEATITAASLTVPGTITAATVNLSIAGTIAEGGSIDATLLEGGATGSVSFTGLNSIGTLGGFTAPSLVLDDATGLAVAGSVTAATTTINAATIDIPGSIDAPASLAMTTTGSLSETGSITTGLLDLSAGGSASLTGSNSIGTLGNVTAAGFTFYDNSSVTIAGAVVTGPTLDLNVAGNLVAPGSISTSLLTGAVGGFADFAGANQILGFGDFSTGGSFTLQDVSGVTFSGALNALSGNIGITAADITAQASASIVTGVKGATATLGTITLAAPGTITLGGLIDAPTIVIGDKTDTPMVVTFASNTIITGTAVQPGSHQPPFPPANGSKPGIYVLTDKFAQTGTTFVNPNGRASTIEISLAKTNGTITFDPSYSAGLVAPSSELFLDLNFGIATGHIDVAGLNLEYLQPGSNNLTDLYGTIDNETGPAAAGAAYIVQPNSNYRFNACPIQSINCILISPVLVPITNPVEDVEVTTPRRRRDDDDLIIPNVGEQDF